MTNMSHVEILRILFLDQMTETFQETVHCERRIEYSKIESVSKLRSIEIKGKFR